MHGITRRRQPMSPKPWPEWKTAECPRTQNTPSPKSENSSEGSSGCRQQSLHMQCSIIKKEKLVSYAQRAKPGKMQTVRFDKVHTFPPKCSFAYCSQAWSPSAGMIHDLDTRDARRPTFAGLPTFAPMTFHLLASYSLIAASSAALC